jgi:hypothetical protein
VALVVACLLFAVACGDDGDQGSSTSSDEDSSTTDGGDDDQSDGGDDDQSDRSDDGADEAGACDLLSTDEVAELLGQPVEDGEQEDIGEGANRCEWATEEPSQAIGDRPINLDVALSPLTDELSGQLDEALALEANEPLDFGDRAVLVCGFGADGDDCSAYDTVAVAVDDRYLEVELSNWGYPDDYSEEEGVQITVETAQHVVDALS